MCVVYFHFVSSGNQCVSNPLTFPQSEETVLRLNANVVVFTL